MTFATVAAGPGPWRCPILAVQLRQILEAACSLGAERASLTDGDGQLRAWAGKGGARRQSGPGDRRTEASAVVRVGGAAVAEVRLAGAAHRRQALARLAVMTAARLAEAWAAAQDVESLSIELLRSYEELHLLYELSEALTGQRSVAAASTLLLEKLLAGLRASRAELCWGEPPVVFLLAADPDLPPEGAEQASAGHTVRTVLRSAGAVVGSIALGRAARDAPFSSADSKLLDAVGALATNALRASGERGAYLRAILENVADGLVTLDERGVVESCNGAVERIFGYAAAEIVGQPFRLLLAAPAAAAAGEDIVGWLRGRAQAAPGEVVGQRQDGATVPLEVSVGEAQLDVRRLCIVSIRDMTERQRTAAVVLRQYQAAEAARSETRAVLDATGEGIALVAPDRRFLTVNRRFAELFGVEPGAVVGHLFDELQELVERIFADPGAVRALVSGTAADRAQRFTETVVQRWPARRELELSSTPVENTAGQPLGRLYAFRDVTREREVDRMKSEFVALVSHELRTPLTSIKGYVDLLLTDEVDELTEEQRAFLQVVAHDTNRLARLIRDLLDIAHIESGQLELKSADVDLDQVIREVAASFRPQVTRKGQRLVVRVAEGLPTIWGDQDRLAQILINLVSNAHKYTPEGGQITVVARPEGDMVRITIEDTGIGLSEEERAQLFTRFFRAKNSTTQEEGGTGLGLAITRSLVETHGGQLTVVSSPGQGSIFSVTLATTPGAMLPTPPVLQARTTLDDPDR